MARSIITILVLFFSSPVFSNEFHEFEGKHFLASYCGCLEEALNDVTRLEEMMSRAIEASGATILGSASHRFTPEGFTLVFLLSESHASIHTYPEHRCCFVDLFTCGDGCSSEAFDSQMRLYLQPETVEAQILLRN